jgi:hypothetical protein
MPHPLFLPSIHIQEFRAFQDLNIANLGRVNLIVGKNNIGKSSLLEALWLYVNEGKLSTIMTLLETRNESRRSRFLSSRYRDNELEELYKSQTHGVRTLFFGRDELDQEPKSISIGPFAGDYKELRISYRWVHFYQGNLVPINQKVGKDIPKSEYPVLVVSIAGVQKQYEFNRLFRGILPTPYRSKQKGSVYIPSHGLSDADVNSLWDKVTLTTGEDAVLSALKIIEPGIEKVNLIGGEVSVYGRVPIAKISGLSEPVPLRSLGDGMNRLLGIALAAVNANDQILLIDEIENGLHYSIQADVWRILFQIANSLNVQIFATTHSWDCISAFQQVANDHSEEGMLIRLSKNERGFVKPTLFDERKLSIATREQIEVR